MMNRQAALFSGLWLWLATIAWAQETPENFGNPWMKNLVDVEPPPQVPWWPLAPGWFVLAGLIMLVAFHQLWKGWRRWRSNAYRREALARLTAIEQLAFAPDSRRRVLAKLPVLLKQTALAAYPRTQVARLSGDEWTGFLDASLGGHEFSSSPARVVGQLSFAPEAAGALDDEQLMHVFATARRWIQKHDARRQIDEAEQ